jgi:hypothetical protein
MKAKDDKPPLKKSTITKAHDIAKSIKKDEKNEEAKYPHKMYSKDGKEVEAKTPADHEKYAKMGYTHKNETHTFRTDKMNKKQKDTKGEKMNKLNFKEAYKKMKEVSALKDEDKTNDPDVKKPKGKTDIGTNPTPVDTTPEVDYRH